MKIRSRASSMMLALIVVSALVASGCASLFAKKTGEDRSASTSMAMENVEVEIRNTAVRINATNTALEDLIDPTQMDTSKAIDVYAQKVVTMEAAGKNYLKLTDKMNAEGDSFFKEWRTEGNEYQDPRIRALSDQRREEVRALYDDIAKSSIGQKEIIMQYIATNNEIKTYLSTDSTPKGVAAIAPLSDKAIQDGKAMVSASDNILETIRKVRTELDANSME